jgi:Protein of unknown function (DUF3822)
MVSKSIDIGTQSLLPYESLHRRLVLEWSPTYLHVLLWNGNTASVEAIESFNGAIADEQDWQVVLGQSRLLTLHNVAAHLVCTAPGVLAIPAELYQAERSQKELALLTAATGRQQAAADLVDHHRLVVAWQMPKAVLAWLQQHFEIFTITHLLSLLLAKTEEASCEGRLVVADKWAIVVLRKQEQLFFAGALPVVSPDDLMYHLLNICRQHQLVPQEMKWQVSGSLEDGSALWLAMDKFLHHFSFMPALHPLPGKATSQYFTHLLPMFS